MIACTHSGHAKYWLYLIDPANRSKSLPRALQGCLPERQRIRPARACAEYPMKHLFLTYLSVCAMNPFVSAANENAEGASFKALFLLCAISRAKNVRLSLNEADTEGERCLESLLRIRATEAGRAPQGASVLRLQRVESGHSIHSQCGMLRSCADAPCGPMLCCLPRLVLNNHKTPDCSCSLISCASAPLP